MPPYHRFRGHCHSKRYRRHSLDIRQRLIPPGPAQDPPEVPKPAYLGGPSPGMLNRRHHKNWSYCHQHQRKKVNAATQRALHPLPLLCLASQVERGNKCEVAQPPQPCIPSRQQTGSNRQCGASNDKQWRHGKRRQQEQIAGYDCCSMKCVPNGVSPDRSMAMKAEMVTIEVRNQILSPEITASRTSGARTVTARPTATESASIACAAQPSRKPLQILHSDHLGLHGATSRTSRLIAGCADRACCSPVRTCWC